MVGDTGCKPRRRKERGSLVWFLSTAGHVEPCGKPGGPSPKAKYVIVNQYREGKVKSTPVRGVKEYLKPYAYKQWEGVCRGVSSGVA
jgi:hypothetical protein